MNAQINPPQSHSVTSSKERRSSAPIWSTVRAARASRRRSSTSISWSGCAQRPGPAFDVPLAEIMDILVATGQWLTADPQGWVSEALEFTVRSSPLPRDVLETSYAGLGRMFVDRRSMEFQVQQELGGAASVDGWREVATPTGRRVGVRAFPPRLVHIIAGNAPGVAAQTVIRGALTKGVHLIKIPSNDLFTATAILRGLSAVAPGHPLAQSFSAVYWRGGDAQVEGRLFRAQYFDKLVAWGGESTIRTAQKYIGPGFELVSFDPKTSISLIGREAFGSDDILTDAAERAAIDATAMNQQACVSSRVQFIEGSVEQIDRFCALLQARLGVARPSCSAVGNPLPAEMRCERSTALKRSRARLSRLGRLRGQGRRDPLGEPVRLLSRWPRRQRRGGERPQGCAALRERGNANRRRLPGAAQSRLARSARIGRRAAGGRARARHER